MSALKYPLDATPYPPDPRSRAIDAMLSEGGYVYVRDATGLVYVVPDGPHIHPKVLGGGRPAIYAGDLTVKGGKVVDLTNLSGTFEFDEEDGLREVAAEIRKQGLVVEVGSVRFFPADGSAPRVL
ncbi:MAG TPA: hypothetical protein VLM40_10270, partial [Gemmata sp.]|nr:hypothetical protein [Gemmata sp.]